MTWKFYHMLITSNEACMTIIMIFGSWLRMVIKMKPTNCRIEVRSSYYCQSYQKVLVFTHVVYLNILKLFLKRVLEVELVKQRKIIENRKKNQRKGPPGNYFSGSRGLPAKLSSSTVKPLSSTAPATRDPHRPSSVVAPPRA